MDTDGLPIPGLYAAGELMGGLFYFNYPGGAGPGGDGLGAAKGPIPPSGTAVVSIP